MPPVACVRRAGSPATRQMRRRSQEVLTLREKTMRDRVGGAVSFAARASFARMPRHAAILAVAVLLAFPGVVIAEDVTGTPRADNLTGTAGADHINGRGGDDRITGRAGNDTLAGARGHDTIFGDAGADRIFGGPGNDTLLGGGGNDRISGGAGAGTPAPGP